MSILLEDDIYNIEIESGEVRAKSTIDDFETTLTIAKEMDEETLKGKKNERARDIYMEIVNRHRTFMG